ncbi:Gfo/Idh/MocA family oxidoreductase [Arcanobacterium haemolyticum]|nr:Gfo/Idh/MocA family oxidoreductase [Arcanobacterium haemolyticum]
MGQPTLAIVGVGRIGAMHARILAPKAKLVIVDANPERAARIAAEVNGSVRPYDDLRKSTDLDGIVITTPTSTHADVICELVALGVPIFCEKPVALDLESTHRANEAAKAAGIPVHIGFQRHFDDAYCAAREGVRSGRIGELRRVHMGTLDQAPAPREFLAASGGIYTDCLIHDFDALRWVTGLNVHEVYAIGTDLGIPDFADFDDVAETVVVLTLDNGVMATAHSSRYNGAGYDVRMELHGTHATEIVGMDEKFPARSLEPGVTYPAGEPWIDFIARFRPAYERELQAFLDLVAGKINCPSTIDDAVASLEIAAACRLSQREHRPVRIDEVRTDAYSAYATHSTNATRGDRRTAN